MMPCRLGRTGVALVTGLVGGGCSWGDMGVGGIGVGGGEVAVITITCVGRLVGSGVGMPGKRSGCQGRVGRVAGFQVVAVDDAVAIRIRVEKVRAGLVFLSIKQPIPVRILMERIGADIHFQPISSFRLCRYPDQVGWFCG
jgi:hypothetical protein